ncbi:MAG: hypothetical protein AAGB19_13645 [Cyanobacteria bacterium P01_F01_bin.3]
MSYSCQQDGLNNVQSPDQVIESFGQLGKRVVTFIGYSAAGYEDQESMLATASQILSTHSPVDTIVNIGATEEGIGAIYEVANRLGFMTTGIVSTQAQRQNAKLSPFVDSVFFVEDASWGGRLAGSKQLAPTSRAIVSVSDVMIGIGGGEIGREELLAGRAAGKQVIFYAADMSHQKAMAKARKNGLSMPKRFDGAVGQACAEDSNCDIRKMISR